MVANLLKHLTAHSNLPFSMCFPNLTKTAIFGNFFTHHNKKLCLSLNPVNKKHIIT